MTRQTLFAVAMVIAMVGAPLTGAVAATDSPDAAGNLSVGVAQDDDITVSVTRNDTGVENASVAVETVDENDTYAGVGDYTSDDDGEVELPAPEENVTVNVTGTVDNHTAMTTADLVAVEENETDDNETDSFGQRVSAYVHALQDDNVTRLGPYVAAFVTANNPGNAPDHAGPPAHAGPPVDNSDGADDGNETDDEGNETVDDSDEDDQRGPPAHAGPPDDAGPPEDRSDDKGADDADEGDDDADEGDDDADEEEEDADDEEDVGDEEDADDEEDETDGEGGPPDHASAP